jgi:hypothetical protein
MICFLVRCVGVPVVVPLFRYGWQSEVRSFTQPAIFCSARPRRITSFQMVRNAETAAL